MGRLQLRLPRRRSSADSRARHHMIILRMPSVKSGMHARNELLAPRLNMSSHTGHGAQRSVGPC